jgi:hypothetical protein
MQMINRGRQVADCFYADVVDVSVRVSPEKRTTKMMTRRRGMRAGLHGL